MYWEDVTEAEVVGVARRLADARSNFVYSPPAEQDDCQYLHEDEYNNYTPGCFWGHVMVGIGIPTEVIATIEGETVDGAFSNLGIIFDPTVTAWMKEIQTEQDGVRRDGTLTNRKSWGEAVAIADSLYPEVVQCV